MSNPHNNNRSLRPVPFGARDLDATPGENRRTPRRAEDRRDSFDGLGRPAQTERYSERQADRQPERGGNLLAEYLRTAIRHRVAIIVFGLIGVLLSFLLNFTALPYYRAKTSLEIQGINGDFLNIHNIAPTGDGGSTEVNVQTQVKLLQSETLLERTANLLKAEPPPANLYPNDLGSRLARAFHLGGNKALSYNDLVDDTAKRVIVKPFGVTRLVEITCDSWNAEFAAKFCNTLTTEYRNLDLETRGKESDRTSQWLTGQVADIKTKAEESERRLVAATGGNGLILSQDSNTVGEDHLRTLQGELVRAQADRMEKEAQLRTAGSAAPGTTPSILDSTEYRSYQQKLADLRAEVAAMVPPLTEENPKVIHVRSQIREVEEGMAAARSTNSDRLQNEFASARHREALLNAAFQSQEASVSSDLGKAAQVNLLRREVESEQQLYQTMLQRAKEASLASAMQASTMRVVDAAKKPFVPFAPKRGGAAGAGLLLGTLCGVGVAFFRDRQIQVFRVPGDVERFLHVTELGVIPAAETNRAGFTAPIRSALLPFNRNGNGAPPAPAEGALALAKWSDAFSVVAEAYRSTTFSILLTDDASRRARIYVVSSPNAGEGKTTVTSNLGVALSKSKLRTVIVDGDLRKPGVHIALQVSNNFGLRNILRGEIDAERAPLDAFCKPTAVPGLSVIPAGTGSEEVVELLHSAHLAGLIDRLHREFDVVLIDTPPMLHMADARILAHYAQGVLLILRAGITSREQAGKARDLFERDRVRLVGTILNAFDPRSEGQNNYYESYYRYKDQIESAEKVAASS